MSEEWTLHDGPGFFGTPVHDPLKRQLKDAEEEAAAAASDPGRDSTSGRVRILFANQRLASVKAAREKRLEENRSAK